MSEEYTKEPLAWGIVDPKIDPVEWFKNHLGHGEGDIHCVWIPSHSKTAGEHPRPDHAVLLAITGNGPKSEANAKRIVELFNRRSDDAGRLREAWKSDAETYQKLLLDAIADIENAAASEDGMDGSVADKWRELRECMKPLPASPSEEPCSWHKERGASYEKCVADHLAQFPSAEPCCGDKRPHHHDGSGGICFIVPAPSAEPCVECRGLGKIDRPNKVGGWTSGPCPKCAPAKIAAGAWACTHGGLCTESRSLGGKCEKCGNGLPAHPGEGGL